MIGSGQTARRRLYSFDIGSVAEPPGLQKSSKTPPEHLTCPAVKIAGPLFAHRLGCTRFYFGIFQLELGRHSEPTFGIFT